MSMRDYEVIKELGSGAFGTVVLVKQGSTKYCVKKVDVRRMPRKERDAAVAEARVLKKFNHPNIVQYKDQFIEDGTLCIVMELAEDGDLHARLKKQRGRPLKEEVILNWFVQICLAMKHVHDRKVLHRDIKTQNIFLTRGGTVIKVGDFGISRVLSNTNEKAKTQVGTPYYLSPEICLDKAYDHKSDIWSLGCVLYELTTLKHAFDAGNMHALVLKIMRGKYTPPPTIFSAELRGLIADMLNRDPSKRPNINQVLKMPVMQNRIRQFLSESVARSEFSHTVLHGQKPMVSVGPGQRLVPAPAPERVRPAVRDAAAERRPSTRDRGGGGGGYVPPRSAQGRKPSSRQQSRPQPDEEGLLTMEAKKVAEAQRAKREQRAAAYKEEQARRPASQQRRAEGGGARPHGLAAARDREEHMRRIKQQQRENEQALQALAQQGRPVASAQAPYGRAGVRGPSRGGGGGGGGGGWGGAGGGEGAHEYPKGRKLEYEPSGAAMYGQGGEKSRIQQAKAREAELREYTRQNALDARRQAEANKQRALESERAEQREQEAVAADGGGGGGGGGGAFDATPVDQMAHPAHQESQPWQATASAVDEYADEAPRERMLRQKRERQDAERRAHEQQLAEARRENHEERKRIAAKQSPGAARSGGAAKGDDDSSRAAAFATAKEKEAAWRAKQQQALDAVGGQHKLPEISPSRAQTGDLTSDEFEVREGYNAHGDDGGGQQLPPAIDGRGTEQELAEPEPEVYGSVDGVVEYAAETFDDYDTIVPNEVVEEEVLVQREGQFDSMRDLMAGVLVESGDETGHASPHIEEDISLVGSAEQPNAVGVPEPTGRDPLTTHGLESRIAELRDELHHLLGADCLHAAYQRLRAVGDDDDDDQLDREVRDILGERNATCIHTLQKLIMCENLVQGM